MRRAGLVPVIADLVGESLTIHEVGSGWPARGALVADGSSLPVALYVAPVGLSQRGRNDVERRFQNPGSDLPIEVLAGEVPLLVGLWREDEHEPVPNPVLVLADAVRRVGLTTRHSVFVKLAALRSASMTGWAESVTDADERMTLFHPRLLSAVALASEAGVTVPPRDASIAVSASGLLQGSSALDDAAAPGERARRSVFAIVRDAKFGRDVVDAYDGLCALCGLDLGLVQGAHIYPASAPGSPDEIRNGLCLCSNHHAAFDRHLLWIDPHERTVLLSPAIHAQSFTNPAAEAFLEATAPVVRPPRVSALLPSAEMFLLRYEHFEGQYSWVEQARSLSRSRAAVSDA